MVRDLDQVVGNEITGAGAFIHAVSWFLMTVLGANVQGLNIADADQTRIF